jgi:hypothetical protein
MKKKNEKAKFSVVAKSCSSGRIYPIELIS